MTDKDRIEYVNKTINQLVKLQPQPRLIMKQKKLYIEYIKA